MLAKLGQLDRQLWLWLKEIAGFFVHETQVLTIVIYSKKGIWHFFSNGVGKVWERGIQKLSYVWMGWAKSFAHLEGSLKIWFLEGGLCKAFLRHVWQSSKRKTNWTFMIFWPSPSQSLINVKSPRNTFSRILWNRTWQNNCNGCFSVKHLRSLHVI